MSFGYKTAPSVGCFSFGYEYGSVEVEITILENLHEKVY